MEGKNGSKDWREREEKMINKDVKIFVNTLIKWIYDYTDKSAPNFPYFLVAMGL